MPHDTLVITGAGVVSSIGIGADEFASGLREARTGIIDLLSVPEKLISVCPVPSSDRPIPGGPVLDFDAKQYVRPRKALKVMCREIQTAFAASQLAIDDAGLRDHLPSVPDSTAPGTGIVTSERIGTVFGSEMFYGDPEEMVDAFVDCINDANEVEASKFGTAAMRQVVPLWMLKYLPNMPACHVGIALAALGPNNTLTLGDVSGPAALYEGVGYLRRGIADVVVVTACGTRLNTTRSVFTEDQPIAAAASPIERSCRPHADDADGIVRGEAAAGLILEPAAFAKDRGHKPIAEVLGVTSRFIPSRAFRSGDRSASRDADAGRGSTSAIVRSIQDALSEHGVAAEEIGLVVSHGMGDPVLDRAERDAISECLPDIPVCIPESSLGHTGACSGMIGLVTAVEAIRHRTVFPVAHASECDGTINVSATPRKLEQPYVLAIAHTSPGSATAVLLRQS
ncbi:MAG: beta-ketoacyl synthase N-terminal-like domain-containing protein [Planctomycetota bacterium]